MNELPYQAEYAKSGKSACKDCKEKIDNGALRIAVMIQSVFFDGKQPLWHHVDCFFKKFHPASINDIGNFNKLSNPDQKMVKSKVVSFSKVVMPDQPEASPKVEGKAEKRAAGSGDTQALNDYFVEYAKTTRVICKNCDVKICKDEVRIKKTVYDTEAGNRYGGQALWYHVNCFAEKRSDLMFFAGGESLPGFKELKDDDQKIVQEAIKPFKLNEIPVKKLKEEPKDQEEVGEDKQKATLIMRQNMSFQRYRKALEGVEKKQIHEMLTLNGQKLTAGPDERLNHLADCMTFGALSPCPECEKGQLVLDSFGYKCTGNLTEWTKCSYVTQEPKRELLKVIDAFKTDYGPALRNYKPKIDVRLFLTAPKSVVVLKEEAYACVVSGPPLKQCEFYLYGNLNEDDVKNRITQLGGVVVTKLSDTVIAVVSTKNEVQKMSPKMDEIKKLDIVVVEDTFLDSIDPEQKLPNSLEVIKEKNIAGWGADPASRIPPELLIPKHGSRFEKSSESVKLKIQGGTAVDPDSGLVDVAHVYRRKDGDYTIYTVVLTQTDVVAQKNSYYKMQVLKTNHEQTFWLFRSWGRIGTSIGGHKLEKMSSAKKAVKKFEDLYKEKTENDWKMRNNFVKVPGRYFPLDIDYSKTKDAAEMDLEVDANSKLPVSVQKLVIAIFDVKTMKKAMLEFELDTDKLPLGKLSKNQINSGYKVLSELLALIQAGNPKQSEIVDGTNRFFTLIPHFFGINNAPLLDNEEIIKTKTNMLNNLLEIEIAYSMMKLGNDSESVIDSHFLKLKSDFTPILKASPEYILISKYLKNTHGVTHKYKLNIEKVFKVVRENEYERFKPFSNLHNRRLLWHGSRITNFAGILSQGLRIAPPEAPVTGYMFGKGIYFADMATKSAYYCFNTSGVLLLCEVALGNMHKCYESNKDKLSPQKHSRWGVGLHQPDPKMNHTMPDGVMVPLGTPVSSGIKSSLKYNEFIVYDVAQVNVKYLLQIKIIHDKPK